MISTSRSLPKVIRILSLDILLPYWDLMGIDIKEQARLTVNKYAKEAYSAFLDGAVTFYDASFSRANLEKTNSIFFEGVKRKLGKKASEELITWANKFIMNIENKGGKSNLWYMLFAKLFHGHSNHCELNIQPEKLLILKELFEDYLHNRISGASDKFDELSLTLNEKYNSSEGYEWDCKVTENYGQATIIFSMLKEYCIEKIFDTFILQLKKEVGNNDFGSIEEWILCESNKLGISIPYE